MQLSVGLFKCSFQIFSLFTVWKYSWLLHVDFCHLQCCWSLLIVLIVLCKYVESLEFSVLRSFHVQTDDFISSFLMWMSFISLSCLVALARTYSAVWNKSDKRRHCFLVPDHRESVQPFTIGYDVSYGIFIHGFYYVEVLFFIPSLSVYIMKGCWVFSRSFCCISLRWSFAFCSSFR